MKGIKINNNFWEVTSQITEDFKTYVENSEKEYFQYFKKVEVQEDDEGVKLFYNIMPISESKLIGATVFTSGSNTFFTLHREDKDNNVNVIDTKDSICVINKNGNIKVYKRHHMKYNLNQIEIQNMNNIEDKLFNEYYPNHILSGSLYMLKNREFIDNIYNSWHIKIGSING